MPEEVARSVGPVAGVHLQVVQRMRKCINCIPDNHLKMPTHEIFNAVVFEICFPCMIYVTLIYLPIEVFKMIFYDSDDVFFKMYK